MNSPIIYFAQVHASSIRSQLDTEDPVLDSAMNLLANNADKDECRIYYKPRLRSMKLVELSKTSDASQIAIVHLAGAGLNNSSEFVIDDEKISAISLTGHLSRFQHLKLLILQGKVSKDFLINVIKIGIPFLLLDSDKSAQQTQHFYQTLAQGQSIFSAYESLINRFPALKEANAQPTEALLADLKNIDHLPGGIYLGFGNKETMAWRMPKKFVIPISDGKKPAKAKKAGKSLFSFRRSQKEESRPIIKTRQPATKTAGKPQPQRTQKTQKKKPSFQLNLPKVTVAQDLFSWKEWKLVNSLKKISPSSMELPSSNKLLIWEKALPYFAVIFGLLVLWYFNVPKYIGSLWNSQETIALEKDLSTDILIIPFHANNSCSDIDRDYEKAIAKGIYQISDSGRLQVNTTIQNNPPCPLDLTVAQQLMESSNSELVVWGSFDPYSLETEINLLSNDQQGEALLIEEKLIGTKGLYFPEALESSIKNVVYWNSAQKAIYESLAQEAISKLSMIDPKTEAAELMVDEQLIDLLILTKDYQEAILMLSKHLEKEPSNTDWLRKRATLYSYTGDANRAFQDLEIAENVSPYALENMIVKAEINLAQGQIETSKELVDQVLAEEPSYEEAKILEAKILSTRGEFQRGIEILTEVIESNPGRMDIYLEQVLYLISAGKRDEANEVLNQLVEMSSNDDRYLLTSANLHVTLSNYDEALEIFQQLVNKNPRGIDAYFGRVEAYTQLERYEEAIADLQNIITMYPQQKAAYAKLANIYSLTGQTEDALNTYNRLIELFPSDYHLYASRGSLQREIGKLDEALSDFNYALSLNDNIPEVSYQRGLLYLEWKQYDLAIEDVNVAIQNNPDQPQTYVNRGRIYAALDQNDKALEDYNYALALAPNNLEAVYHRGMLSFSKKAYQDAIDDLQKSLYKLPNDKQLHLTLAKSYRETGNSVAALNHFETLYKMGVKDQELILPLTALYLETKSYNKALALIKTATPSQEKQYELLYLESAAALGAKKYEQALSSISQALKLAPDSIAYYCHRANVYAANREYELAKTDFLFALELDPLAHEARLGLGEVHFLQGNLVEANSHFDQAKDLAADNAEVFYKRAMFGIAAKDYEAALQDLSECINIDANYAEAYNQRGKLLRSQGKFAQALEDFDQAILAKPGLSEAYYNRGFLHGMQSRYEEAITDLKKSIELGPATSIQYGTLAKMYARQRNEQMLYPAIESALEHKYPVVEIRYDPAFEPYRDQEKFKHLIEAYQ